MLAHSPPLPLIIDYSNQDVLAKEDEEGIVLSLQHRERVHRIRLDVPASNLQRLILALDEEFPMLACLVLLSPAKHDVGLVLPETFRAPNLRHLILLNFALSIGSPLLTTGAGLVKLFLDYIYPSTYFRPNYLLQRLSLMPQLEVLGISFHSPVPNREVKRQLLRTPAAMTHVTLPNLRWFAFRGVSAYLEALLPRMTTPLLEKLQIVFFTRLTLSIPHLLQFINRTSNLRFTVSEVIFDDEAIHVRLYPHEEAVLDASFIRVGCTDFEWQVATAAQISAQLETVLSAIVLLTFKYGKDPVSHSQELNNEGNCARWREILRPFDDVTTLRISDGLVKDLSRSLQADEGETPLELLPELKGLTVTGAEDVKDVFTAFIDARQNAGRPVILLRERG
jgi:hypothetical protein